MRPGHGQVQVHFRNDFSRSFPNLPNFRRLIADGSWGPMLSTILCDTPTNWTAFATGATSGITGFAFHTPGESLREEGRPGNAADYEKARTAEFIWEAADEHMATSAATTTTTSRTPPTPASAQAARFCWPTAPAFARATGSNARAPSM